MGPVSWACAGSVSVTSVCRELPGPLLTTVTTQSKGCIKVGLATVDVLVVRRSTRWRAVVCSPSLLLPTWLSGSLAATVAVLLKMSPVGAGWSNTSKRRKMFLVAPDASSPTPAPLARLPAGTAQVKAGMAVPGADVTLLTEHKAGALQVLPPKVVVSQTKRTRLPAGGTMFSVTCTPVPKEGPLLVTATW